MRILLKEEHVYLYAPRGVMPKGERRYLLLPGDDCGDDIWAYLGKTDLTGEIEGVDNFDPRPSMIAALRAKQQRVQAEAQKEVTEIDRQISELLAIEHMKDSADVL